MTTRPPRVPAASPLFTAGLALGLAGALGSIGCGSRLPSSLQGVVFVDGRPAPEGLDLVFTPTAAEGSPAYASTGPGGRYEAAFTFRETGITTGKHRVSLLPGGGGPGAGRMPVLGPDGRPAPDAEPARPAFPREYYQEITTIDVAPGANEVDLRLTTAR